MRSGLARQVVGCGVPWLVERQIRAARQLDRGEEPPALVADRAGDLDAPGGQVCQRLLDIFAHQVELVLPQPVSGVDGDLGWRQLEDQPTVTGVDPGKSEHVADEDPVGLRVGAVENDMCSVDHGSSLLLCSSIVSFRHFFAILRVTSWPSMPNNGSTRSFEETKELGIVYDSDANVINVSNPCCI